MPIRQGQQSGRGMPLVMAVIALAVLGVAVLVYLGAQPKSEPEEAVDRFPITFDVERINERDSGYLVQVTVRNLGPEPVSNLHIEGQLYNADRRLERSVGQLEAVPSGAARRIGLFFVNDPRHHELRLMARDLQNPQTQASQTALANVESAHL